MHRRQPLKPAGEVKGGPTFETVLGLLEFAAEEGVAVDEEDARQFLRNLRDSLPPANVALTDELTLQLNRAGAAVGLLNSVDVVDERCQTLMMLAERLNGASQRGAALRLVQRAHRLATSNGLLPELRLSASGMSILLREAGAPHHALPFALQAIEIARGLGDTVAEARGLINASSALHEQGKHGEAIRLASTALRLRGLPGKVQAGAYTMILNAALGLRQFALAAKVGAQALQCGGAPTSIAEAEQMLVAERSYIESLVAVGDVQTAKKYFPQLKLAADACRSDHALLQVELAEAALALGEMPLRVGVTMLLRLLERTRDRYQGLHHDILGKLIAAYELEGNTAAVAKYTAELSASMLARQSAAIKALSSLGAIEHTVESRPANSEMLSLARLALQPVGGVSAPGRSASADAMELAADVAASQSMFEQLAVAAELQEDSSGRHAIRVGELSRLVARELGVPEIEATAIGLAARLHDIGKLAIPTALLGARTKFTDSQKAQMQRHTVAGERILSMVPGDSFAIAKCVARSHHERWDGRGYPDGRAGEAIPLAARITKVADVWDALVHERVYKPAWPVAEAFEYFEAQRGVEFCPTACTALLAVVKRGLRDAGGSLAGFDELLSRPYAELPAIRERDHIDRALGRIPNPWTSTAA